MRLARWLDGYLRWFFVGRSSGGARRDLLDSRTHRQSQRAEESAEELRRLRAQLRGLRPRNGA